MTGKVALTITGLQFDGTDNTEYTSSFIADYYERNGKRYVVYDEITEGFSQSTKNIIKFGIKEVEVSKKGIVNVVLPFEENKRRLTNYRTPYGDIIMGIETSVIRFIETNEHIRVDVEYDLELNHEHQADCKISIDIRSLE